jgi:AraC-like DNA-binding protein
MAITDIAVEVGYNSYVTFSRAFLHRKGFSAGVFRSLKANNAL